MTLLGPITDDMRVRQASGRGERWANASEPSPFEYVTVSICCAVDHRTGSSTNRLINAARWPQRSSSEEKGWKKRLGVWFPGFAGAAGSNHLLALALGRRLDDSAFASDRSEGAAVQIVDVAAHLLRQRRQIFIVHNRGWH